MSNGESWLWRPMRAGMCRYESVIDGTLSLDDIATMNEILDVERENELRIEAATKE